MAVGHRSTKLVRCALVCFSFCPLVQELLKTQTALRNLIQRNRDLPVEVLAARNKEAQKGPTALQLPFILIQVSLSGGIPVQIVPSGKLQSCSICTSGAQTVTLPQLHLEHLKKVSMAFF